MIRIHLVLQMVAFFAQVLVQPVVYAKLAHTLAATGVEPTDRRGTQTLV